MSAIGALLFCTDCGRLLPPTLTNKKPTIICGVCGTRNKDVASKTIHYTSRPGAFPSILRAKNSRVQQLNVGGGEDAASRQEAEIDKTCPECGNKKMKFYTLQLRSVDEGSTVFYTCSGCGYKESTNN